FYRRRRVLTSRYEGPPRGPHGQPVVPASHSGHFRAEEHVQACGAPWNVGAPVGVIATKPRSKSGEAPEKTSFIATLRNAPPLYGIGITVGDPTVCGPSWVPGRLVKPAPTRLQVSPFSSTNAPVIPAVVGSAASVSWLTRLSPASKVAFEGQPWPSLQVVASSGVDMRIWMPLASFAPFPFVTLIRPRVSAPCPVPVELHAFEFRAGSSAVPHWPSGPGPPAAAFFVSPLSPVSGVLAVAWTTLPTPAPARV